MLAYLTSFCTFIAPFYSNIPNFIQKLDDISNMENRLPNMENTEQSLEKTDDNYKVPNLEKGIAVIEYLSSRSEGETLQAIKVHLIYHRLPPTVS